MSRLTKYNESLNRFIKEKTTLADNTNELTNLIFNKIKTSNFMPAILFLTVMNNQNKKKKISVNCYPVAISIELLDILLNFIENRQEIDIEIYIKIYNKLICDSNKLLFHNLQNMKNSYKSSELINIILQILNLYNELYENLSKFQDYKKEPNQDNSNSKSDLIKWYLKNNTELIEKLQIIPKLTKDSILEYINKKYLLICEQAILLGWIMGGGESQQIPRLKKIAKYFSVIFKLSQDFEFLELDIMGNKNLNYILNFGIQDGYEQFLHNKEKLIEDCMLLDIYTDTLKEIINSIENKIDNIIDQTSPDLKSSCSK